jgi:LAO/AO transport system kinase
LELKTFADNWRPPVLLTIAHKNEGVGELLNILKSHWRSLAESGGLKDKRQSRRRERIRQIVERELGRKFWNDERTRRLEEALAGDDNPFSVAGGLTKDFLKQKR